MIGPGQDLDKVIQNMHVDSLKKVLGEDVVRTLRFVSSESDIAQALRRIASEVLYNQPERHFSDSNVRELIYCNMSNEALDALATRIGLQNYEALKKVDPSKDAKTFSAFLGYFGVDLRSSAITIVDPDQERVPSEFGLFKHQRRAAQGVWNAIGDGHGRVVLHMPTGAGKTRTAMHVVSRYLNMYEPAGVVWLTSSAELLEQATDAFKEAWPQLGNRDVELLRMWGRYQPNLSDFEDGLLIAGLQKMHSWASKNPLEIFRFASRVKLVVVDEAHQSIAPTYREVINQISFAGSCDAILGLTATPGRTWADIQADEELADFFENRKVTLDVEGYSDPISFLVDKGYLARPNFRKIEYKNPDSAQLKKISKREGSDFDEDLLERISRDASRNAVIIGEIRKLIEEGHTRIIFFSSSVRHAEIVSAILVLLCVDARVVTGASSQIDRQRIIKAFRSPSTKPMVLCNFGVLTTGFDAPQTSAAVIARPTKSLVLFSQMVGRATRGPRAGGNNKCTVSTVVDTALPGFGDIADAFTNWEDVWNG